MAGIALLYDDDAYVEHVGPPRASAGDGPSGLMGRQVAGRAFLDAYLAHGDWEELVALVRRRSSAESITRFCRDHPSSRARSRRLKIVEEREFHREFIAFPPAAVLHQPCPPDPKYAWARRAEGPHRFCLTGVTHTLCSQIALRALQELMIAPFESYDALVCTSRAVERMVRATIDTYGGYLHERLGASPRLRARLEVIPLGVDAGVFRPATPEERRAARARYTIAEDETVVLFVGRLAHHAKAHPFPLFAGVHEAARRTGRKVFLLMAGWAANAAVRAAFEEAARRFAASELVRVAFVDGTEANNRRLVWRAADVFCSPSDNIQETFGLSVVEAMSAGLAVVASDWDGYRDTVTDGETGLLVPTYAVRDANVDVASRHLMGEVDYDHYLAETSQTITVDPIATADALSRLVEDEALRRRLGAAARAAVLDRFAWNHIVARYEALWAELDAERQERYVAACEAGETGRTGRGPECYPAPDAVFEGYPTRWIGPEDRLQAAPGSSDLVETFLRLPLTSHVAERRNADPAVIRGVLTESIETRSVAELDEQFGWSGLDQLTSRTTLAWMLKYGLLRLVRDGGEAADEADRETTTPGAGPGVESDA